MTWGTKILLVFIGFALLIGTLVYKCMRQNFDLVSKDYYADELKYQETIDGAKNASLLTKVQVTQTSGSVDIRLPKELDGIAATANAWFYCPTNARNDRRLSLVPNATGIMTVNKTGLPAASYTLKLKWMSGSKTYFTEQPLTVLR